MIEASVTLLGNLVDDPDVRCTQNGNSVCSLRLASTSRRFDRSQNRWVDGHTVFVTVTCWRHLAENVGASLHKGDRTLVVGRLRQRSFETQDGSRRVVYEVDADAVAVDLTRQSAAVRRVVRVNRESTGSAESTEVTEGDGNMLGCEPLAEEGRADVHNGQTGVGTGAEYHDGGFTHAGADEFLSGSVPGGMPTALEPDGSPSVIPAQRPAAV
ncbi:MULTISPECIES: single-stranded DNA-binding protein [unclassified Frankia]|uniref:single-stranded DNA-binding protein n=1 Tax=unclassified Frankia TaxID=2632575 RepID=UPI001EF49A61|nr:MULTISPECIES: single-stranded DNA-binding protein [unclassified Frankia]